MCGCPCACIHTHTCTHARTHTHTGADDIILGRDSVSPWDESIEAPSPPTHTHTSSIKCVWGFGKEAACLSIETETKKDEEKKTPLQMCVFVYLHMWNNISTIEPRTLQTTSMLPLLKTSQTFSFLFTRKRKISSSFAHPCCKPGWLNFL